MANRTLVNETQLVSEPQVINTLEEGHFLLCQRLQVIPRPFKVKTKVKTKSFVDVAVS